MCSAVYSVVQCSLAFYSTLPCFPFRYATVANPVEPLTCPLSIAFHTKLVVHHRGSTPAPYSPRPTFLCGLTAPPWRELALRLLARAIVRARKAQTLHSAGYAKGQSTGKGARRGRGCCPIAVGQLCCPVCVWQDIHNK